MFVRLPCTGYTLFISLRYQIKTKLWVSLHRKNVSFLVHQSNIQYAGVMQPSMDSLNSPASRIVKDSTPYRRRILRYMNFGIGESSPILFLDMMNLHLIIFEAWWIFNERTCVLLFYYFLYFQVNLDLEKTNQLGESSSNFIFTGVNLDPIILEKRWIDGESWPNDFLKKVNRGEDLRWVG